MRVLLDGISFAFALGGPLLVAMNYARLPARVPLHFNWRGEPDRWGTRATIWLLPVIGLAVYALWFFLTGVAASAPHPPPARMIVLLALIKTEMLGMFYFIERGTIRVALGQAARLDNSVWVFLAFLIATGIFLSMSAH